METCPHCDYQSSVSRPNCPSCGLIKNMRNYDKMLTNLSNGRYYENGKRTNCIYDEESLLNLRKQINKTSA